MQRSREVGPPVEPSGSLDLGSIFVFILIACFSMTTHVFPTVVLCEEQCPREWLLL